MFGRVGKSWVGLLKRYCAGSPIPYGLPNTRRIPPHTHRAVLEIAGRFNIYRAGLEPVAPNKVSQTRWLVTYAAHA